MKDEIIALNHKMEDYKKFETERLLIKPTSIKDTKLIFEILNTPKWLEHVGDRNIKTFENAKDYLK